MQFLWPQFHFSFFFGADFITSIFTRQPDIKVFAVNALRIISIGYIFYGIGMVMSNAFNGAGDTRTPTLINVFGFWTFQIPMAYILAKHFNLGPTGVFISIPIAETAITIASYILFKKRTMENSEGIIYSIRYFHTALYRI